MPRIGPHRTSLLLEAQKHPAATVLLGGLAVAALMAALRGR